MYQALLTRRYLTSKLMPLLAALAVMLCTALVLVTWSIMGGFLAKFLEVGKNTEGDVIISWPTAGFGYYEELMATLNGDPMVAATCPTIESFGVLALPDDRLVPLKIRGIDERYAKVANFAEALWWKPITEPLAKDKERKDLRLAPERKKLLELVEHDGLTLSKPNEDTGKLEPAVVLGIEVAGFSERTETGVYQLHPGILRRKESGGERPFEQIDSWIVNHHVTINVLPLTAGGRDIKVASRKVPVANEFRTGVFEADKNMVLFNLAELQRMLKMEEGETLSSAPVNPYEIIEEGGKQTIPSRPVVGRSPARVTHILVKAKPGVDENALRDRCEVIYRAFAEKHGADVPAADALLRGRGISTWKQNYAMFIAAVEKETAMVLGLLLFISFVAVFLILAIFWAMVSEKTKDVGVLRAVGAGRGGIAWLWLRYGLSLGVVGTVLGVLAACLIIWNINPIHEWLGRSFGFSIWDPKVYYFSEIPNKVVPAKAAIVMGCGLLFSILGALIPAIRAASYDPVKALRFE